jgi:hypothetical protein
MPLTADERKRRTDAIEVSLKDGFAPHKQYGGRGSSLAEAARRLGNVKRQTLQSQIEDGTLKPDWGLYISPDVPDGFKVTGRSTLVDMTTGEPRLEWVKTSADKERQEQMMKDAAKAFYESLPPIKPPNAPPKYEKDIIPWFQIGDAHMGMLAHEAETGANFDLKIAERELCGAFETLFSESTPCERCVINDLGDGTHYENMSAVTEASGHRLDYDSRFPKMISVYSLSMRFIVDRALEKYRTVDVIISDGNHSTTNGIWMAELLRVAYGKSGRVNVLNNSSVFIPYRMGNTFVMVHHGHKAKGSKLIDVMATDFRQDWGETEYHYIDVGHLHHKEAVKESGGATIEMWNTLAAKDRYGHDGGWRAAQSITRVDRSKTDGEVGRRVLPIQAVRRAILKAHGDHYCPPERRLVHAV